MLSDLTRASCQCVHFANDDRGIQSFMNEGHHYALASIDSAMIDNKSQLLDAIAQELRFPDYFGGN